MRRLLDLGVVLVLVVTAVFTVRSFREGTEPPPEPEATEVTAPAPVRSAEHERILAEKKEAERRKEEQRLAAIEKREQWRRENEEFYREQRRMDEEAAQRVAEAMELRRPWYEKPLLPDDWGRPGDRPGNEGTNGVAGNGDLDARRKQARQKLEMAVSSLSGKARSFLSSVRTYQAACGEFSPDGNCQTILRGVARQAIVVGRDLHAAQELARVSWISPGEMRALREKYGLGDAVWDQLVTLVNTYAR